MLRTEMGKKDKKGKKKTGAGADKTQQKTQKAALKKLMKCQQNAAIVQDHSLLLLQGDRRSGFGLTAG